MKLYKCLKELIGMTAYVVVAQIPKVDGKHNVIAEHNHCNNVEDDLNVKLWNLKVSCVTVLDEFPNKIVVFVYD